MTIGLKISCFLNKIFFKPAWLIISVHILNQDIGCRSLRKSYFRKECYKGIRFKVGHIQDLFAFIIFLSWTSLWHFDWKLKSLSAAQRELKIIDWSVLDLSGIAGCRFFLKIQWPQLKINQLLQGKIWQVNIKRHYLI